MTQTVPVSQPVAVVPPAAPQPQPVAAPVPVPAPPAPAPAPAPAPIPKPTPLPPQTKQHQPKPKQTKQQQQQQTHTPKPVPVVVTTDTISACIQSVISRLRSPSPVTQTVQSQQYSTPTAKIDSSGGGPPPKKKPKPSKKKKVTLDLEQLLKQSGIMDEDLEDDGCGSFADFFSPCPQEEPVTPVHIPQENGLQQHKAFNNNNNSTPINNNYKPNGTQSVSYNDLAQHVHVLKPSAKTKQKHPNIPKNQKNIVSVPTPVPPPPPPKKPPAKSKSKKKAAEAAAAVTIKQEYIPTPTPPPKPPPKSKAKGKKATAAAIANAAAAAIVAQVKVEPVQKNTISTNSNFVTPPKKSPKGKGKKNPPKIKSEPISSPAPAPYVPSPNIVNSNTPSPSPDPMITPQSTTTTRIVQTIQLTPQNQQLLRNIQAQIQRLLSLSKRNETEQTALQKLIVLQQQVIATGTPVPNPVHLQTVSLIRFYFFENLRRNVDLINVEMIQFTILRCI